MTWSYYQNANNIELILWQKTIPFAILVDTDICVTLCLLRLRVSTSLVPSVHMLSSNRFTRKIWWSFQIKYVLMLLPTWNHIHWCWGGGLTWKGGTDLSGGQDLCFMPLLSFFRPPAAARFSSFNPLRAKILNFYSCERNLLKNFRNFQFGSLNLPQISVHKPLKKPGLQHNKKKQCL